MHSPWAGPRAADNGYRDIQDEDAAGAHPRRTTEGAVPAQPKATRNRSGIVVSHGPRGRKGAVLARFVPADARLP
jgi:hypothetical protein